MNIFISVYPFNREKFSAGKEYHIGDILFFKGNLIISIEKSIFNFKNTTIIIDLLEIVNSINYIIGSKAESCEINISGYPELRITKSEADMFSILHVGSMSEFGLFSYEELEDFSRCIENMLSNFVNTEVSNLEDVIMGSISY